MTIERVVGAILILAALLAMLRIMLWHRASISDLPSRGWRVAALLILQPVCAGLLFLFLFPPPLPVAAGTLVVATAGAKAPATSEASAHFVALPEAPAIAGAEPVPDLGTALRRYPGAGRVTILGEGLKPRDLDAARGLAVSFTPPAERPGLVSIAPPRRVAPGAGFAVGGRLAGLPGASVELVDPAGQVTDKRKVDGDGWFSLAGTARAAGLTSFALRVRDADGRQVEQADVPVAIDADTAPRLLIMAGAPGPEVKYLRRWATDAGFAVTTRMSAGGGIALGDAPVALDPASLRRFDVAIIDDRSWSGLGGQRAAVMAAVRDGLGLILRASGPLDGPARAQWQLLGFTLTGGNTLEPIALPPAGDAATERTRQGIGSADVPADINADGAYLPELDRLALIPGGNDTVALVRDAGGETLSAWRGIGMGRVALFTGVDSYGLTLVGRHDLYGDWWGTMLSALARPAASSTATFSGIAWAGERLALCETGSEASVVRPDGAVTRLLPERGCAAFWPTMPGWHVLRDPDAKGAVQTTRFHVQPSGALPAARAARDRDATLMLSHAATPDRLDPRRAASRPSSPWPWFIGWLAVSTLLWWLERSRYGRAPTPA